MKVVTNRKDLLGWLIPGTRFSSRSGLVMFSSPGIKQYSLPALFSVPVCDMLPPPTVLCDSNKLSTSFQCVCDSSLLFIVLDSALRRGPRGDLISFSLGPFWFTQREIKEVVQLMWTDLFISIVECVEELSDAFGCLQAALW